MPAWFWFVLAISVVGEVVTVWLVLRRVRARSGGLADLDFRAVRALSSAIDQCVTEHLGASYSGDPARLDEALRGLLPKVREQVRLSALPLDERGMRLMIVSAIAAHKLARRGEVLKALDGIAAPEQANAA